MGHRRVLRLPAVALLYCFGAVRVACSVDLPNLVKQFTFLHIPKNAGTTLEHIIRNTRPPPIDVFQVLVRAEVEIEHQCFKQSHKYFPPLWHYTPEAIERCEVKPNPYKGKRLFCVVRDPIDRLVSEFTWRLTTYSSRNPVIKSFGLNATGGLDLLSFAKATAELVTSLRQDRPLLGLSPELSINENMLHLQPQSWYVYNSRGEKVCHEVLEYGHITTLLQAHENETSGNFKVMLSDDERTRLRQIIWDAYEEDFHLHGRISTMHFTGKR